MIDSKKIFRKIAMELLIALIISVAFSTLFKGAIKKLPIIFYATAVIINIIYLSDIFFQFLPAVVRLLFPYMQRGLLAFGLFSLVMFIGALSDDSRIKQYFKPVRGELSILAALLVIGHITNYAVSYFSRILMGFSGMSIYMILAFVFALILVVLLSVLTVTSFHVIKKKMNIASWKNIQKTAYLFYGLIFLHAIFLLTPSMLGSGMKAAFSVTVYTAILVFYIILRVRKLINEKKAQKKIPA